MPIVASFNIKSLAFHPAPVTNKQTSRMEDVPALNHAEAEGLGEYAKHDYAEELMSRGKREMAELQSSMTGAGYLSEEDLILLGDERYHEHEFIHRLADRVKGEVSGDGEVPEDAERIIDQELAETYGVPLEDTVAYVVEDYHDAMRQKMESYLDDGIDVRAEGTDIVTEADPDEFGTGGHQLEELVAHYLTEDSTPESITMFTSYGILPWTFRDASRALERIDKDSDYDRGVMARRALGHDSVLDLIDTGEELPEVGLLERRNLNGKLWDESRTRLVLRSIKDKI
jgi:hypothetical protein